MLERAFQPGATFTAEERALAAPIARAVDVPQPADERCIRQSIGSLAAALPSQDLGERASALKLNVYVTMLAGCDSRALDYACRRCLAELDWLPTVHQLLERMQGWVSPEAAAINRARRVMRAPVVMPDAAVRLLPAQIRALSPEFRAMGITTGAITQADIDAAVGEGVAA